MKKAFALVALVVAFGTAAHANYGPVDPQLHLNAAPKPDVTSLYSGPAGAVLERQYFSAPQQPFTAKARPRCTVQMLVFEKTRLAQSCN